MRFLLVVVALSLNFFLQSAINAAEQVLINDTATINSQTRQAYLIARKDPDIAVRDAHTALSHSREIMYEKGVADASLALGLAYFAKYNPDDSSAFYNHQALGIYRNIDDASGVARAAYCLAYVYSLMGDLDESEKYSRMSVDNFRETGDDNGMLNAMNTLIHLARQKGDSDAALEMTNMVIETARSVNDTAFWADALNTLGNIYKSKLIYSKAMESYYEALKLWELKNDSTGLAIAYGSLALMYDYQKEYDKALEFNFRKAAISESKGEIWELSKCLNNISGIYAALDQLDSSVYYLSQSLHLNETMNYPSGIASACYKIGSIYMQKGDLDSADYYLSTAVDIARRINDPGLSSYLTAFGHFHLSSKDFSIAIENGSEAYRLAVSQDNQAIIASAAGLLNDIYFETGRKALAYDYLKEFHTINEKINQAESKQQVAELLVRYETEKNEQQIQILEQSNLLKENRIRLQVLIIGILALSSLIIILAAWFWIRNKNQKLQQMNKELQFFIIRQEHQDGVDGLEQDESSQLPGEMYKKWKLTDRESEILYYLGRGYSNTTIGEKLFISENTVKFHIKNIYLKLDVKNRIQALLKCKDDQTEVV
ncbi:MAG: tetratricopeptide repeat protein [Bacteroidales bacterium]